MCEMLSRLQKKELLALAIRIQISTNVLREKINSDLIFINNIHYLKKRGIIK